MRKYVKSFQGLRVIAALMVFMAHAGLGVGFGSFAVTVFFLLSGFLAQMKHAETDRQSGGGKECLRSLAKGYKKYLPLHCIMLLAASILTYKDFIQKPLATSLRFAANLFLVQCWSPNRATNVSFNSLSWFLSAMMFCLFLSPIVVQFFSAKKRAAIGFFLLIAVQFATAIALNGLSGVNIYTGKVDAVEGYRYSVAYWLTYICPPARVLNYATGCALFTVGEGLKSRINVFWNNFMLIFSAGLAVLMLYLCYGRDQTRLFDVAVWLVPSCGIVLSLSFEEKLLRWVRVCFSNRAALFFGSVSFEFYMTHELVLRCARAGYRIVHVDSFALYLISSFVVSVCAAVAIHAIGSFLKKNREGKRGAEKKSE